MSCWGANGRGQVGNGGYDPQPRPFELGLTNIVAMHHRCAVGSTGSIWCWGEQWNNDGLRRTGILPTIQPGVSNARQVSSSGAHLRDGHSCALNRDRTITCWGGNQYGEIQATPSPFEPAYTLAHTNVADVSVGRRHTCILSNGVVSCWGHNSDGELGNGTRETPGTIGFVVGVGAPPIVVEGNCALLANHSVVCGGMIVPGPASEPVLTDVAGIFGSCFVRSDHTAWCFNDVMTEQLADLGAEVAGLTDSCALMLDGTAQCWGQNSNGQLGDGTTTNSSAPVIVGGPTPLTNIESIVSGSSRHCALVSDHVECWGDNWYGQLGDGTTEQRNRPVPVRTRDGVLATVASVAMGNNHACAVLTDGTVACWGNINGECCEPGEFDPAELATPIPGLTDIIDVAAGNAHTCVLHRDGSLSCWGDNTRGQLGDGGSDRRSEPARVGTILGASSLRAHGDRNCVINADHVAVCWGDGDVTPVTQWDI